MTSDRAARRGWRTAGELMGEREQNPACDVGLIELNWRFVVRTLMSERFAPITSRIGFIEMPLDDAASNFKKMSEKRYRVVDTPVVGFPDALSRLEPLVSGVPPRELLVAAGSWTAYFDCLYRGTDPLVVSVFSNWLECRSLTITSCPSSDGVGPKDRGAGRLGGVQFDLFGPTEANDYSYVRSVSCIAGDTDRWRFDTSGEVQDFEEVEAYSARRVRDRFTSEMLERYCQALGIDVFDPGTYGPEAVLFESNVGSGPDQIVMTLSETQEFLGVVPGAAEALPG